MVSFFGLKLGGDKKKAQSKRAEKQAEEWKRPATSAATKAPDSPAFGNFSRPRQSMMRPGTSYSIHSPTTWQAPYMGSGATSSMVELAPPPKRRPSISSLRQAASDTNLKQTQIVHEDGTVFTMGLPPSLGGGGGQRPSTAPRPGTAGSMKKDFWKSSDIQTNIERSGSTVTTPTAAETPMSPLSGFEFGLGGPETPATIDETASISDFPKPEGFRNHEPDPHGYPSPPLSVNGDGGFDHSSSRQNAPPSGLRRTDIANPTSLPSPAASVQRESDQSCETHASATSKTSQSSSSATTPSAPSSAPSSAPPQTPVIRNVQAKRDTMWYRTPKRRSFTMEVEEGARERKPQTEGFTGNFAAFDFGGGGAVKGSISSAHTASSVNSSILDIQLEKKVSNTSEHTLDRNFSFPPKQGMGRRLDSASSSSRLTPSLDRSDALGLAKYNSNSTRSESPFGTPRTAVFPEESRDARSAVTSDPRTTGAASREKAQLAAKREDQRPQTAVRAPESSSASGSTSRGLGVSSTAAGTYQGPASGLSGFSFTDARSGTPTDGRPRTAGAAPPRPPRPIPEPLVGLGSGRPRIGDEPPRKAPERPQTSPYTRPAVDGDFPVSKGLPRGRRPTMTENSDGMLSSGSPRYNTGFDQSAMPAPLSPRSPPTPQFPTIKSPSSTLGVTSSGAPRLPSPTFPSLEMSITESSESDSFAKALELAFDSTLSPTAASFASPTRSEFGGSASSRAGSPSVGGRMGSKRLDPNRAPPRPPPIVLPPSANGGSKVAQSEFGIRSPPPEKAGFI